MRSFWGGLYAVLYLVFFFFQKRDYRDFKNALFRMSPKSSHCFFMLSRVNAQLWV